MTDDATVTALAAKLIKTIDALDAVSAMIGARAALSAAIRFAAMDMTDAQVGAWLRDVAASLAVLTGQTAATADWKPSVEQVDHAVIAQQEATETLQRLISEGMDFHAVATGATTAIADMMRKVVGDQAPTKWFANAAALTGSLGVTRQ